MAASRGSPQLILMVAFGLISGILGAAFFQYLTSGLPGEDDEQAEKTGAFKPLKKEPIESREDSPSASSDQKGAKSTLIADWKEKLQSFHSERIDTEWAKKASQAFDEDLGNLAAGKQFTPSGTECRSSSCLTRVTFPSYREAQAGFEPLLHGPYQMSCSTEIVLPEPKNPEIPYEAKVLHRCAEGS